jgi:hypothetical protein
VCKEQAQDRNRQEKNLTLESPRRFPHHRRLHITMTEFDSSASEHYRLGRRVRELRRPSLEQIAGEGAPRQITLGDGANIMGRDPDAQVRLESKRASRQHAIFRLSGTDCVLFDNDSQNGVFLNGFKIHSAVLRDGDVIQAADSTFLFYEG